MSQPIAQGSSQRLSQGWDEQELQDARLAMRLSLIFGLVMLLGKVTAYVMTHSAAILSDAAESVVHVVAVAFAAFSLRLSAKPAAPQFLYGYERITFFSAVSGAHSLETVRSAGCDRCGREHFMVRRTPGVALSYRAARLLRPGHGPKYS